MVVSLTRSIKELGHSWHVIIMLISISMKKYAEEIREMLLNKKKHKYKKKLNLKFNSFVILKDNSFLF